MNSKFIWRSYLVTFARNSEATQESSSAFRHLDLKVVLATEGSVLLTMINKLCLDFRPLKRKTVWKKPRSDRHRSNILTITKGKPKCAFSIKSSEHNDEKALC